MHADGEGLYLRIGPTGGKSWMLRTVVHGHRREPRIGSASLVSLAEAREKARQLRKVARDGGDSDTLRKRENLTFEEAAKKVHTQPLPTWRNKKHSDTWLSFIETYANPFFGKRPIATVNTADVLKALTPIWTDRNETANRVNQRIAAIFDWARSAGHYPHENPVNGLKKALPVMKSADSHVAALPWQDRPALMSDRRSTRSR